MNMKKLLSLALFMGGLTGYAQVPLPHQATWQYVENGYSQDTNAGNNASDHSLYDLGGCDIQQTAGECNFYIAISQGEPLANTMEFFDKMQVE